MAGHSQDPHPSLISRIYNESNESNESNVSNDCLDDIRNGNSNIAEVVDGISNQMNEIQENGDNFLIGKWIIFFLNIVRILLINLGQKLGSEQNFI